MMMMMIRMANGPVVNVVAVAASVAAANWTFRSQQTGRQESSYNAQDHY